MKIFVSNVGEVEGDINFRNWAVILSLLSKLDGICDFM